MTLELIGRMQLWHSALADCAECLSLADRLSITAVSGAVKSEEIALRQHYESKTGRQINPLVAYGEDFSVFESFQRDLPTPRECDLAANHLRGLGIIYFMQLYNDGDEDPGKVARNKDVALQRNQLEQLAFPDSLELKDFRRFTDQLRKIRNRQIGHASGPEFEVQHQPNSVVCTIHPIPLELVVRLRAALQKLQPCVQSAIGDLLQAQSPNS